MVTQQDVDALEADIKVLESFDEAEKKVEWLAGGYLDYYIDQLGWSIVDAQERKWQEHLSLISSRKIHLLTLKQAVNNS